MALGNRSGSAVFLGGGSGHSVVRWSAKPAQIVGRCGRCGAQKDCTKLAFGGAMDTLTGEFVCDCGSKVKLSVPLGFRKGGF